MILTHDPTYLALAGVAVLIALALMVWDLCVGGPKGRRP